MKYTLLLLLWLPTSLSAQSSLSLSLGHGSPVVDGLLDKDTYGPVSAQPFTQSFPTFGTSSPHPTAVYTAQDADALYVYAELHYADTTPVSDRVTFRDNFSEVDYFNIYLDPYESGLQGYRFGVTAAGTQFDRAIGLQGGYDAVWTSVVRPFAGGWAVELRIPLFNVPHAKRANWGVNFGRYVLAERALSYWYPVDPRGPQVLRQSGTLTGWTYPDEGAYAQAVVEGGASQLRRSNAVSTVAFTEYGGDTRVRLAPNRAVAITSALVPEPSQLERLAAGNFFGWRYTGNPVGAELPPLLNFSSPGTPASRSLYNLRVQDYRSSERRVTFLESIQANGISFGGVDDLLSLNQTQLAGRTTGGFGVHLQLDSYRPQRAIGIGADSSWITTTLRPAFVHSNLYLSQWLPNNGEIDLHHTSTFHPDVTQRPEVWRIGYRQADHTDTYEWSVGTARVRRYDEDEPETVTGYAYRLGLRDLRGPWRWRLDYAGRDKNFLLIDRFPVERLAAAHEFSQSITYTDITGGPNTYRWSVSAYNTFVSAFGRRTLYAAPGLRAELLTRRLQQFRLQLRPTLRSQDLSLVWASNFAKPTSLGASLNYTHSRPGGLASQHRVMLGFFPRVRINRQWYLSASSQLDLLRPGLRLLESRTFTGGVITTTTLHQYLQRRLTVIASLQYIPLPVLTVEARLLYRGNSLRNTGTIVYRPTGSTASTTVLEDIHTTSGTFRLGFRYRPAPGAELQLTYFGGGQVFDLTSPLSPFADTALHRFRLGGQWYFGAR